MCILVLPARGTRKSVRVCALYIDKRRSGEERETAWGGGGEGGSFAMGSREWRDACRARLAARISVVDAYISIASSTSRRSNSALSVHPPHPTAAPWVAAIHSALLYRSLRSSPRHDRRCERTGSECTCDMWLVYVGVRETRCVRRYDRFVSSMNFGLDKTRLCALASKLARDGKYTDRFKFLGLRLFVAAQWINAFLEWRWCIPLFHLLTR